MAGGSVRSGGGFADRLRNARETLGISAKELDRRSGLHEGHTALIERGDRQVPSSDTAVKLARALRRDVAWLLTGESYTDADYQSFRDKRLEEERGG